MGVVKGMGCMKSLEHFVGKSTMSCIGMGVYV